MIRENISHLVFPFPILSLEYVESLIKEDLRGIIQRWINRKPLQVQMMSKEKVELSRICSKNDQNGNTVSALVQQGFCKLLSAYLQEDQTLCTCQLQLWAWIYFFLQVVSYHSNAVPWLLVRLDNVPKHLLSHANGHQNTTSFIGHRVCLFQREGIWYLDKNREVEIQG